MPRVAVIQLCSKDCIEYNIKITEQLIRKAAAQGAIYIQTPENTNIIHSDYRFLQCNSFPESQDPMLARCIELAKELRIWLHLGSLILRSENSDSLFNRSLVIDPSGTIIARYDKIHLFDVELDSTDLYHESSYITPGNLAIVVDLPFARLGFAICYDLRFPSLFRALAKAGAVILTVPAAFTKRTGEMHWEVLLRARAIENGAFVLAAAQAGHHNDTRITWGHSMIVAPTGRILEQASPSGIEIIYSDLNLDTSIECRSRIPSLCHDRKFTLEHSATC